MIVGGVAANPAPSIRSAISRAKSISIPIQDLRQEWVRAPVLRLKLPMAHGGNIGPDVLEIDPFGVHRFSMTAIILHLSSAVAARLNRCANAAERLRPSLCVVKETIVARVKPAGNGQARPDLDCSPMTKTGPRRPDPLPRCRSAVVPPCNPRRTTPRSPTRKTAWERPSS